MTVEVVYRNLFDSTEDAIVITVNCGGIMGKGVAEGFKHRYPLCFFDYNRRCKGALVKPGRITLKDVYRLPNGKYAILFPTKSTWRRNSDIEWIKSGLKDLCDIVLHLGLDSIAMPPPGCGNGGLDWDKEVGPLVHEWWDGSEVEVVVCR
jgi:O-acetyl-ADP-ribose deacetylase (regulator of RNase III)